MVTEDLWKDGLHLPNGGKSTLANNFINHLNNFYLLELENFCNNIHAHKIHKHTQQILNENNVNRRFISAPSSNLRHKNYETNIKMKKCPCTN